MLQDMLLVSIVCGTCFALLGLAYVVEGVARYAITLPRNRPGESRTMKVVAVIVGLVGYCLAIVLVGVAISFTVKVGGFVYLFVGFVAVNLVVRDYVRMRHPNIKQKSLFEMMKRG
jgi:ABC-type Fe3+ transport system permease subunit